MKKKIKSLSFIKFVTFFLLSWILHFHIYVSTHEKSLNECYNNRRKLYTRYCRSLAKYKQIKNSSIVCLKEDIPNGANNKKDIFSNEKRNTGTMKQSNGNPLYNVKGHKQSMKNKSCIFETKKYSHLEKKIFKELDYEDFLKNNKTISDKIYKKIIFKKCGLRVALPILLFFVLVISFILDNFCRCGLTHGLLNVIILCSPVVQFSQLKDISYLQHITKMNEWYKNGGSPALVHLYDILNRPPLRWFTEALVKKSNKTFNCCVTGFLGFLIYVVPLFILGIILISGVFYYHKKVKKYQKIKFRKR
ncbi:hypothetical protein MKS88_004030 [Plasmodium brasilianum]|uniref:Uncharacterized protein n=1 Tax=Plasmodium brasilianum TaxID=5824 RepID=A0ACB9Y661_PLABR|nr:hypothetical protein MKS88_004030 [Plasmodium brasilianum]